MKRYSQLYLKICDIENIEAAYRYVRLGKRYDKNAMIFGYDVFNNIIQIRNELIGNGKTYKIGQYRQFIIREPKERLIQYLSIRDRIVQQSLHQIINPIFEKCFIYDSYACRKGKGTHRAMKRLKYFLNAAQDKWNCKELYYLHCDIHKFFPHIDHNILYSLICHKIKCPDTLKLIKHIIDSSTSNPGLPIGNLFSQLAANIYLNVLDQFIKHELRNRFYLRYMDNFIIIHHDKKYLQNVKNKIEAFLDNRLHLQFNHKLTLIDKAANGIEFVGYIVYVDHVKIKKASIKRMKKRLRVLQVMYREGRISLPEIRQRIQSWLGHCCHADAKKITEKILANAIFIKHY
jgi:retron-type reverse transcriptase